MALSKGKAIGHSSIVPGIIDYKPQSKLGKLGPKVNPMLKNVNMLAAIDSDEYD
jgi:hypothetical protein